MTYTLEDYCSSLHAGAWFGFNNLNGTIAENEANKTYANLVIHSADAKPTEQECIDGVVALQAVYDSQAYSRSREAEYPSIGDQLDMIYHNGDGGATFQAAIKAVKDKYPK